MNGKLALITLGLVLVAASAFACHFDSECGPTGRCVNALCLQTVECTRNLDCLRRGLYFECSNGHCITSKHKVRLHLSMQTATKNNQFFSLRFAEAMMTARRTFSTALASTIDAHKYVLQHMLTNF